MASRKIEVEIVGDARSLQRAFGKSGKAADDFGSKLGGIAKGAAVAGGAAGVGLLTVALKTGINEYRQSTKVAAQTAAVIKSTGGAANVTAKGVDNLSNTLLKKTGIDDEVIKSGANMLLTFTNIRNETGKGNKVFDQATKALVDMSTATGQDMTKSAIQLGKALNDPLSGLTALKRVGVTFTAQQVEMIKSLEGTGNAIKDLDTIGIHLNTHQKQQVQTMGDLADPYRALKDLNIQLTDAQKAQLKGMEDGSGTIKAQKVVLHELNKEFGGSAEAIGKTLPGQISILKEQFKNFTGQLVADAIPVLERIVVTVRDHWPQISRTASQVFAQVKNAWAAVQPTVVAAGQLLKRIADIVIQNWPLIRPLVMSVAKVIGDAMKVIAVALRLVTDILSGRWAKAWQDAKALVVGIVTTLKDYLMSQVTLWRTILGAIGTAALSGLKATFGPVVGWVKGRISDITGFFAAMPMGIARSVEAGAASAGKLLRNAIGKIFSVLPGFVRDALGIHSPSRVFADIGHNIIMGAVHGIERAGPKLLSAARSKFAALAQTVAQPGTPAGAGISTGGLVPQVKRALFYARSMGWHGVVTSGFRTYAQQAALYARYLAGGPLAAPPGHSSHESGQAVDVSDYGTFGRIMATAPAFERLYNRLGALDPVHYSVSGYAKGGIFNQPTLGVIGEAGPEAVVPLAGGGIDISELGAQRIADAADRTTWARSPEVHVEELREALAGNALPITVMRLSDDAVAQMTGAFTGAADAIGGAVAAAVGSLGGGGGGDGGGDGGGGGPTGPGITPLPIMLGPSPGDAGTIRQKGAVVDTGPGPGGGTVGGHEGIHTINLQVDGKTLAKIVQKHANKYEQVNGSWLP